MCKVGLMINVPIVLLLLIKHTIYLLSENDDTKKIFMELNIEDMFDMFNM